MLQYRKKPVVIDAFQYRADGSTPVPDWFCGALARGDVWFASRAANVPLVIKTLEGEMVAQPGDYIIRGIKGEIYPCKPDIFEATYDPVPIAFPEQKKEDHRMSEAQPTTPQEQITSIIELLRGPDGRPADRETALAITKLEEALHWLQARKEQQE